MPVLYDLPPDGTRRGTWRVCAPPKRPPRGAPLHGRAGAAAACGSSPIRSPPPRSCGHAHVPAASSSRLMLDFSFSVCRSSVVGKLQRRSAPAQLTWSCPTLLGPEQQCVACFLELDTATEPESGWWFPLQVSCAVLWVVGPTLKDKLFFIFKHVSVPPTLSLILVWRVLASDNQVQLILFLYKFDLSLCSFAFFSSCGLHIILTAPGPHPAQPITSQNCRLHPGVPACLPRCPCPPPLLCPVRPGAYLPAPELCSLEPLSSPLRPLRRVLGLGHWHTQGCLHLLHGLQRGLAPASFLLFLLFSYNIFNRSVLSSFLLHPSFNKGNFSGPAIYTSQFSPVQNEAPSL